jgi:dihydroneopterin aldolase
VKDVILLEGIEVPAALGVSKAERQMRRPVHIDLELGFDLSRSGRSDRLADTLDYGDIYRTVEEVAGTRENRLVEALAERIAAALLSRHSVEWCTVTVRKLAPVAGTLRHAGVRITRSRGG